jgi:hypothetical protein
MMQVTLAGDPRKTAIRSAAAAHRSWTLVLASSDIRMTALDMLAEEN